MCRYATTNGPLLSGLPALRCDDVGDLRPQLGGQTGPKYRGAEIPVVAPKLAQAASILGEVAGL